MKKVFLLLLSVFLGTLIVNAACSCEPGFDCHCPDLPSDPLIPSDNPIFSQDLFNICDKRSRNCQVINNINILEDHKYDLFEIKNSEIYLNNSEITLQINYIVPEIPQYKIHLNGTNKIYYLNNINYVKIDYPNVVKTNPSLYGVDYLPITVEGNGTLEIVTSEKIKKSPAGETYYKCWMTDATYCDNNNNQVYNSIMASNTSKNGVISNITFSNKIINDINIDNPLCVTEITSRTSDTIAFDVPQYGYTFSDIKTNISLDIDKYYITSIGDTVNIDNLPSMLLLRAKASLELLQTVEGRNKYIDDLFIEPQNVDSLLKCTSYIVPTKPVTEEAQITADWGLEYIETNLRRSFSDTGLYLINFKEEKNMVKTTKKDNIVFESSEEFDPNYHLVVEGITEKITDVQSPLVYNPKQIRHY